MARITLKLFNQRNINEEQRNKNNHLIFSKKWDIVGINLKNFHDIRDLKELKNKYDLYNFFSTQARFRCLIKKSKFMDLQIMAINFNEEINHDEKLELQKNLKNKKIEELVELAKELYDDDFEISEIKIKLGNSYGNFSNLFLSINRNGTLETDIENSVEIEFETLLSKEFLGILSGKWEKKCLY